MGMSNVNSTDDEMSKAENPNTTSTNDVSQKEEIKDQSEKKPKKFVFNCTKCGQCCEKWEEIPVYIEDLVRWNNDGSLPYVMQFLQIKENGPYNINLVLKRAKTGPDDTNPSGCPLYDHNNKICNMYYSMPLYCAAYPLAYNGTKYYLVDTDCPGLGNGKMTKESLALARTRAQEHYNAKVKNQVIMPLLYSVILADIMRKSQEAMNNLSDEDKKKLEELLEKSKEKKVEADSNANSKEEN